MVQLPLYGLHSLPNPIQFQACIMTKFLLPLSTTHIAQWIPRNNWRHYTSWASGFFSVIHVWNLSHSICFTVNKMLWPCNNSKLSYQTQCHWAFENSILQRHGQGRWRNEIVWNTKRSWWRKRNRLLLFHCTQLAWVKIMMTWDM